jgi:hypothetical protein
MRKCTAFGLAALMCTAAVPAFAAWNHVGSVMFSTRSTYFAARADFRGDRLALTSRIGDVYCRNVEATFGDGQTRSIYTGMLRANDTVNIDLPGKVRSVQKLAFDCAPTDSSQATVDVAANTFEQQPFG